MLVSSLLTHWLRLAHETEQLGADESVQDRMARIAEHYVGESRELLEDDPDLRLDVADPPGAVGATSRDQAAAHGTDVEGPTAGLSKADIEQAFAEIAEHYEEISREVFGDEPPLSVGDLTEHHLIAYRFAIPEKPRSSNWTSTLFKHIERILTMRPKKPLPDSHYLTLHVRLPAGERIDGPALLYVEPDPVRSELSTVADQ